MCHRSHEDFFLTRTVMLLCIRDKVITDLVKSPGDPPATLMKLLPVWQEILISWKFKMRRWGLVDKQVVTTFTVTWTIGNRGLFTQTAWNLTCMSGSKHSSSPGLSLCDKSSRSYWCPVLHRYTIIAGRSRVGSIQTGVTGSVRSLSSVSCALTPTWSWNNVWRCMRPVYSHGTSKWRLKILCLTTTTVPPTESLTPSPSLNPSKTLTNCLRNLASHTGYPFLYFYIFVLLVHIRGIQTSCFQNTTTVSDTHHTFHWEIWFSLSRKSFSVEY